VYGIGLGCLNPYGIEPGFIVGAIDVEGNTEGEAFSLFRRVVPCQWWTLFAKLGPRELQAVDLGRLDLGQWTLRRRHSKHVNGFLSVRVDGSGFRPHEFDNRKPNQRLQELKLGLKSHATRARPTFIDFGRPEAPTKIQIVWGSELPVVGLDIDRIQPIVADYVLNPFALSCPSILSPAHPFYLPLDRATCDCGLQRPPASSAFIALGAAETPGSHT